MNVGVWSCRGSGYSSGFVLGLAVGGMVVLEQWSVDRLNQTTRRKMKRKIPLVGNEDTHIGCDVRGRAALVEINDGDAVILEGGRALIDGEAVGEEREDDNAHSEDAPGEFVGLSLAAHIPVADRAED